MDLEYSDDQAALRDSARDVLAAECPIRFVRGVAEGTADAEDLWRTLVELGWPALLVPEATGGLGLSYVEVAIVLEEMGRVLAPGPFLPTVTQLVPALLRMDDPNRRDRLLEWVLEGSLTGALVDGDVRAEKSTDPAQGWVLNGTASNVLCGTEVTHHLVHAEGVPDSLLLLVPAEDADITRVDAVDPTRSLAQVGYADTVVAAESAVAVGTEEVSAVLGEVESTAAFGLAAECLGTCEQMFEMTLQYAKEREQFDRPIGSFQAIKHKLADMLVACERANALVYFAALTLAEGDERREMAVHMAKAGVGDCQRLVMKESLQIHGGIGYTWEHDLHLFMRRVKTSEALFGSSREHKRKVAELLAL